jgi:hypothetical protein
VGSKVLPASSRRRPCRRQGLGHDRRGSSREDRLISRLYSMAAASATTRDGRATRRWRLQEVRSGRRGDAWVLLVKLNDLIHVTNEQEWRCHRV